MNISGKISKEHRSAIKFFADKLISKQMQQHVSVKVVFTKYQQFFGETEIIGHNAKDEPREFALIIKSDIDNIEKLKTLSHEMVHVKQYLYKQLNEEMTLWEGKPTRLCKIPYDSQPWEKEAWSLGDKLFEEYYEYTKSI
jgi:hypothetical protein